MRTLELPKMLKDIWLDLLIVASFLRIRTCTWGPSGSNFFAGFLRQVRWGAEVKYMRRVQYSFKPALGPHIVRLVSRVEND